MVSPSLGWVLETRRTLYQENTQSRGSRTATHEERTALISYFVSPGHRSGSSQMPSAGPFPAATLYVNCTPLAFIIKSADLNSWDEGCKAVFTQRTHLPSLYGNETWSLFTAGLWNPKWGVAGCRGRSLRPIHTCTAKLDAQEAWILILLCPQQSTCIMASLCIMGFITS